MSRQVFRRNLPLFCRFFALESRYYILFLYFCNKYRLFVVNDASQGLVPGAGWRYDFCGSNWSEKGSDLTLSDEKPSKKPSNLTKNDEGKVQKPSYLTENDFPSMIVKNVYEAIKMNRKAKYSWLQDNLGVSESTVQRAIDELKKLGYISSERAKVKGEWQLLK